MIKDPFRIQISLDFAEEYETTQNYVSTLFDSLPRIQLSSQEDKGNKLIRQLLQQNQQYGKKIIELSQKFTSFYRKDHIFDKKDVQEKINQIYQILVDEQIPTSLQVDQMLSTIVKKLKSDSYNMLKAGYQHLQESRGRSSQIQNILANKMVESKIELRNMGNLNIKESKPIIPNQNLYLDGLNPNGQNLAQSVVVSRKQSIQSKNKSMARSTKKRENNILEEQVPLKKILKIKALMQDEQTAIKQLYDKINGKINQLKISKLNLSAQKFTYTRIHDETNRQSLQSLLEASTSNHKSNLNNLSQLLELIFSDVDKKFTQEMQSENRFAMYSKEIEKREEVYSYAVSKLIGHVNSLKKNFIQQNYRESMDIVEDLIGIATKFYQLYPSNSIMKDLKVKPYKRQFQQQSQRNYAVQVNTMKSTSLNSTKNSSSLSQSNRHSAQYQLEMFKFETKLTQILDKFQKTQLKFKKSIQVKEVTKFMSTIKQLVPQRNKSNMSSSNLPQISKFEEEYRLLVSEHECKQQKLMEQHQKKQRKLQKQVRELEHSLELLQKEKQKELSSNKQALSKLTKKLDSCQEKYKQAQKRNEEAQKIVKLVQQELESIKRKYREEQLHYEQKYQQLQQKLTLITQQTNQKQCQLSEISSQHSQKQSQFQNQLILYKKKIVLLEQKNSTLTKENQTIQNKLQSLALSAQLSKEKLSQMTEVYQNKIQQVESMIEAIKQLKDDVQKKDEKIFHLEQEKQKLKSISSQLQIQVEKYLFAISTLKQNLQLQKNQKIKAQQIGQLNETDIHKLKDQMLKVHSAYVQSEHELESLREIYQELEGQSSKMEQQNRKLTLKLQQITLNLNRLASQQKNNNQIAQNLSQLESQHHQLQNKCKLLENELSSNKQETKNLKQQEVEHSRDLRELRQQLQKHKQQESLLKGKHKIELESIKIELRKKTQENSKLKEIYQEKVETLSSKYKQLQKFVTQKQMLSKISNNHSTQ